MPVTVYPDDVKQGQMNDWRARSRLETPRDVLQAAVKRAVFQQCGEIFQSSFSAKSQPTAVERFAATDLSNTFVTSSSTIGGLQNGLVRAAVDAYSAHFHLILRPDDVWIAILVQFNLFVNAHAEELRHLFVAHKGQKQLVVKAVGTRYSVDFGSLAKQMTEQIHENVIDPELRDWFMPTFSTTTPTDTVIYAVTIMATLKAYFSYGFGLTCGLPAVTLLGEKADWEQILLKVEKLNEYGVETTEWASLLKPVLTRFVRTFDDPEAEDIKFFWQTTVRHDRGSGYDHISGWITAFCFFGVEGKKIVRYRRAGSQKDPAKNLELDGARYPYATASDIPTTVADVPVELDDNGELFDTLMIAGLATSKFVMSEPLPQPSTSGTTEENKQAHAMKIVEEKVPVQGDYLAIQPVPGWWICNQANSTKKIEISSSEDEQDLGMQEQHDDRRRKNSEKGKNFLRDRKRTLGNDTKILKKRS